MLEGPLGLQRCKRTSSRTSVASPSSQVASISFLFFQPAKSAAGFSDPIYAEAYVKMHGFDILLDVLLVNQTANTLQNLCLDFATLGDLKIIERPSVHTIAPHGFQSIKATIKVGKAFSVL